MHYVEVTTTTATLQHKTMGERIMVGQYTAVSDKQTTVRFQARCTDPEMIQGMSRVALPGTFSCGMLTSRAPIPLHNIHILPFTHSVFSPVLLCFVHLLRFSSIVNSR